MERRRLLKALPILWLGLAASILLLDYLAGPLISLSILYVVPVALAARWSSGWWGVALAAFMPMVHLGFMVLRKTPWPMTDSFINTGIRMAALVGFAVLIDRVTRQERELKVLRGLLPVCCFCKRIRTAEEKWEPIEFYITERSEARFTHTICPKCGQQHYREYFEKMKAGRGGGTPQTANPPPPPQ
jgi:hypothetical protein